MVLSKLIFLADHTADDEQLTLRAWRKGAINMGYMSCYWTALNDPSLSHAAGCRMTPGASLGVQR